MDHTFLSKLVAKTFGIDLDIKKFLYVESKWLENSLELLVSTSYNNKAFKGQLSAEQFDQWARELDMPVADFYEQCKVVLTRSTLPQKFEFELLEDKLIFRIIKWNKLAFEYLAIPLKSIGNNSVMLDNAVNLISELRVAKTAGSEMMKKEELLLQLEQCIKEKDSMEKQLLEKFLLLINSKKKKINELKELLREYTVHIPDNDQNDQNQINDDDDFEAITQVLSQEDLMEAETSRIPKKPRIENEDTD